ncbi:MAG: addiction module toxin RelE [Alkaliphilus sp.]|nr:type II toxin-antitoxin system RelE/ParE family toxin [Alkaliphilus transvaalensis]PHS28374.1 MAG: addiction module toxin RelE [Alkaliphilus sp.]
MWQIEYYAKRNGTIPVLNFLLSLPPKFRAKAYVEIELLKEHGINLREPYVKSVKGKQYKGLYQLRIRFGSDSSRIFYYLYHQNTFVLLHAFLKKSNSTPIVELEKAMKNKTDYEMRCNDE